MDLVIELEGNRCIQKAVPHGDEVPPIVRSIMSVQTS